MIVIVGYILFAFAPETLSAEYGEITSIRERSAKRLDSVQFGASRWLKKYEESFRSFQTVDVDSRAPNVE